MSPQPETPRREFELPRELEERQRKAVRLEWITIAYDIVVVPVEEIDIPSPGVIVGGQDASLSGSQ